MPRSAEERRRLAAVHLDQAEALENPLWSKWRQARSRLQSIEERLRAAGHTEQADSVKYTLTETNALLSGHTEETLQPVDLFTEPEEGDGTDGEPGA